MTAVHWQLAATLADLLTRENDALQRMDFAAAVSLLPDKQATVAALGANRSPAAETASPAAAALGRRIVALASENRTLLERAIIVQTRIVGIVARAARPATPRSYGADGHRGPTRRAAAIALSTRA